MVQDPRFQTLKETYKEKHFSDNYLANALVLFREKESLDSDWYPETSEWNEKFDYFINYEIVEIELSKTASDLNRDSVYNLYTTLYSVYSPEKLSARLDMLARDFRSIVTKFEKSYPGWSRQQIIAAQAEGDKNGYAVIMNKVFDLYKKRFTDVDKMMEVYEKNHQTATQKEKDHAREKAEYWAKEYNTILENKERLAALAAVSIGQTEGFVVTIKNFQISMEEFREDNEENNLTEPSENNKENKGEDITEGSKGDRYGDYRTLKLMGTLGPRAKRLISDIPKVNSKGDVIKDDLDVIRYVDGRQVAPVLFKVLNTSTPETMMDDLRVAAESYPWIRGLIDMLNKDIDSRATVYCNFKKAETLYMYTNFEDGKYGSHVANSRAQGHALMREAGGNMSSGYVIDDNTSIYMGYGALKSLEEIKKIRAKFNEIKELVQSKAGTRLIRMVDGDTPTSQKTIDSVIEERSKDGMDLSYLRLSPKEAMDGFLSAHPEVASSIAGFLRGMGFAVSKKDIELIASQTSSEKGFKFISGKKASSVKVGRNKLYQLVDWMDGVYNRAEQIYEQNLTPTGQYLYNTAGESLGYINNCISLAQYKEVEARVVNEDKSLSAYNNMNLLHQTFDALMNKSGLSEEEYQTALENDFLQYEGMALEKGEKRKVFGWLSRFMKDTGKMRETFRVEDSTGFNHVEYENLSRAQKITNAIVKYFGDGKILGSDDFTSIEIPIQSDYSTAYNFVFCPRLSYDEAIDELSNEVLLEIERIDAIQERLSDDSRVKLPVLEKQGLKFQIFPEFNENGFLEAYKAFESNEDARAFLRKQVREQMEKVISKDIETVEKDGVFTNKALKNIDLGFGNYGSFYSEDGTFEALKDDAKEKFREFCVNVYYSRQQASKILTGGVEQFNGLIDYEKRNMLTHATRTSLYTKATWKGQPVGKENEVCVYLDDDVSKSIFIDALSDMAKVLFDEKYISKMQYDALVKAYSEIKTTDGQGFRTLDSYREVMIMADQWDDEHETAYRRIKNGKFSKDDFSVFMQNIKPVLTGYEHIPAAAGEKQKPVRLTVLHKYSEAVLLPMALAESCLQARSIPMQALDKVQATLKKAGKPVDLFLFSSNVKVGSHSVLQPFAKTDGERNLKDADSIASYIVDKVLSKESVRHIIPYKYFGIAASTPAHIANDKIAWASQAEKEAYGNIEKGDIIYLRGEKRDALESRETYNAIKTANIIEQYQMLRRIFVKADELEKIFQDELASKSYSSRELAYAISHLKDGTFALPLFSPNIEHQIQELLSSIIKKRLTKPKAKGANVLQATGLGMDIEASIFSNNGSLAEDEKVGIVFESEGKNRRIKYVEVFMPIHDSRLNQFADKNGGISPSRLKELVDTGVISEQALEFIAYRTPSDAEHSIIPCRVKGFTANTGGATIVMPKEIMVMTGHDYDGDKMRCHFPDFNVVWDEEKIKEAYDEYVNRPENARNTVMAIFGDDKALNKIESFESFSGMVKSKNNPNAARFKKVEYVAYDYNKSPLENSQTARNNARVELMFSQLTSPAGSRRMIIPGGAGETAVIAKSMFVVRNAKDNETKAKVAEAIINQEIDKILKKNKSLSRRQARERVNTEEIYSNTRNTVRFYDMLIRRSNGEMNGIMREVSSLDTPFSLKHSVDAFEYIMGGSEMIGIYAVYNSSMAMLQRADLNYVPKKTEKGKPYTVTLFGKTFGKLFEVRNHNNRLAILGLARLINAAVDNNKDPLLGHLNQTPEMSEMTFLLFSAGITEEEIHLLMNQPVIIELVNRMKQRGSESLASEAIKLIEELSKDNPALEKFSGAGGQYIGLDYMSKQGRNDFIANLATTFDELKSSEDEDLYKQQIALLQTFVHLNTAADNLATFVRLVRPESESGAIGTSIPAIIAKVIELNKFRNKLITTPEDDLRVSGMREILARRDVHDGWDSSYIEEILGTTLPEVVALNSLMIDTSLDMFRPFFPQARASWVALATTIAEEYDYKKVQDGTIKKVMSDMILWKLLSDKRFIAGNPQEEQKRIIVDVPKNLKDLKERISRAQNNRGKDPDADALIGNAFLEKLIAPKYASSTQAPRIKFTLNGPALEGQADMIKAGWNALLQSKDKDIRQLALDLFKYNLYTNGFSYGMYEFSHMAPFSVLLSTPGYIDALYGILNSDWKDEKDRENFINQYYLNHWGDKKFLPFIKINDISPMKKDQGVENQIWLSGKTTDNKILNRIKSKRYVVILSGENNKTQTLYKVEPGNDRADVILVKATKAGVVNKSQQVTLNYNPTINYRLLEPVVPGNDSAWGNLVVDNPYAEANYSNTPEVDPNAFESYVQRVNSGEMILGANFFGLQPVEQKLEKAENKVNEIAPKNENVLKKASPQQTPTEQTLVNPFGLSSDGMDMDLMNQATVSTSTEDNTIEENGKMLHILRQDEKGDYKEERVPASPNNVREARRQKVFAELNKRLREILRQKGIDVGVLTEAEARMSIGGVTDFDTATVTAAGLLEMIRVAEGYEGEEALPEEFAHMALAMLGRDNPLVSRLINVLNNNDQALDEAYDGMYSEYVQRYGEENKDKLVLEAAGKLVAKHLFRQQEIETKPIKSLVRRIVDAIKSLLRRFSHNEIQNAIFDANEIASKVAREMLGGKLLDEMSFENISENGQYLNVKKDLSDKHDILNKLLKIEAKRLSVFKKRQGYANKNKTNKSIEATEAEIAKLESAIKNYKTEDAIVTYMSDTMNFLAATEKSLDDTVKSGRPVNDICKKLNTVRDTLFSFSAALDAVQSAISDGEIIDSQNLRASISQVGTTLNMFYQKYNKLAMTYFEEMLSSVYGEHGKTVTVGKQKGRVITIHEMATKGNGISLASRWFHAIADCNDYVLKAIDDITRTAKYQARQKANAVRPRIEEAFAELKKETGSTDQSFMFEMARYDGSEWCNGKTDDGKLHKTGRYISEAEAKNLSPARKKFYFTMMDIKSDADQYVPESLVDDRKIVMMRKYTMDRFKDAEGAKGKAIEAWEGLKNRVMDTSDNLDFENYEVQKDFEGNRVDMLPVKFLMKGKSETYDDMSDDVAASMMAYAGMAYEYGELNNVIGMLENAKYMASQRDVVQKTGNRTQRETIETDDIIYHTPFTVKQARTNTQKALDDFFQMHIYGHIRANEGTFGNTRISKRKVVDTINAITSYSQMAINIPQRIANVNTGFTQILIESVGKGAFKGKDVAWASALYMKESADRLSQTGKTDYDNKLSLWAEKFDIHQNNGRDQIKYKKGRMSRIFNSSLMYAGLTMGEDYLACTTSLALARNYKVKDSNGKEHNLWDAYEVKYFNPKEKTGAYLALKKGYTKLDGSPITGKDEIAFSKRVAGFNFELQGIYNLDDKSAIQQYAFGALLIMYRKWIAPALKRRYAGVNYNILKDEYQEGYHVTMLRLIGQSLKQAKDQVTEGKSTLALLDLISDFKAIRNSILINWNKLNDYEKSNCWRSFTELGIVIGLYVSCSLLGKIPPQKSENDDRGKILKWWDQMLFSQMLRLRTEIGSQAPTPMLVDEALHVLRSPMAAIEPLTNAINGLNLLIPSNYWTDVKAGRYKGHSKAYKYFRELPVISMFKKVDNFIDPTPMIRYYQSDVL